MSIEIQDAFAGEEALPLQDVPERDPFEERESLREHGIQPVSYTALRSKHPDRRPEIIQGLLRESETINVIAAAKVGKSWLSYGLAVSIAGGLWWLGKFKCNQGRVLIIDNELHADELSFRLGRVVDAMDVNESDIAERIDVVTLRGRLKDINQIGVEIVSNIERGHYSVIILDAKYRAVLGDENSNDSQRDFYNLVDQFADQTGAAWVLVHHSTKGDQSGKAVTDIGAGGGSQARAADVHLILRDHEEDGCAVLDAALRSHAPIEPCVLRFCWPLWQRQEHLDARDLKTPQGRGEAKQTKKDREGIQLIRDAFSETGEAELSVARIKGLTGFGSPRTTRLLSMMKAGGVVTYVR